MGMVVYVMGTAVEGLGLACGHSPGTGAIQVLNNLGQVLEARRCWILKRCAGWLHMGEYIGET